MWLPPPPPPSGPTSLMKMINDDRDIINLLEGEHFSRGLQSHKIAAGRAECDIPTDQTKPLIMFYQTVRNEVIISFHFC